MMSDRTLKIEATRSGLAETVHEVHVVVCDSDGSVISKHGDEFYKTFDRSCGKPLQLLTVLTLRPSLIAECSLEEIAIMAGSHAAEEGHIKTVRGILDRYGLDESLLQCGTHHPVNFALTKSLILSDSKAQPIHNLCSAKHTAMLLACQEKGWSFENYVEPEHPIQLANRMTFSKYSGCDADEIKCAPDGCGVPTWYLDLKSLATAFARFGDPDFGESTEINAREKIFDAYHKASWWTAGTGWIGTDFNEVSDGKWLGKVGGDGVFAVSMRGGGIGIIMKVVDGSFMPLGPALMHVMKELDFISVSQLEKLNKFARPVRKNCLGDEVGYVQVVKNQ